MLGISTKLVWLITGLLTKFLVEVETIEGDALSFIIYSDHLVDLSSQTMHAHCHTHFSVTCMVCLVKDTIIVFVNEIQLYQRSVHPLMTYG